MRREYEMVELRERPALWETAAEWFHGKWGVPAAAYRESMAASGVGPVPRWYVALRDGRVIGGVGVIENDFHDRRDLTPNVCALYVEEDCRRQGLAGALLERACGDLRDAGIAAVYLVTDHTSFYERYGWEFLCMVQGEGDPEPSRMYVRRLGNNRTDVANPPVL